MSVPKATSDPASPYRLPRNALPRRYELHIAPDLKQARFSGSAKIALEVLEASTTIICNAIELEITSAKLSSLVAYTSPTSDPGPAILDWPLDCGIELDRALERVTFTLPCVVPPGDYVLDVVFSGILNDQMHGFYRSTYRDGSGNEKVIAVTQFEQTDARRAFPCFDEPDMKAIFSVTLDVEPGLVAISNGAEIESVDLESGRTRIVFADTIPLSSYLVAFVVGPLTITDGPEVDGVKLRLIHTPGKEGLTGFPLDVAGRCLDYFARYFSIPYPGDKYDLVAVPDLEDAMENFGCATFREAFLLVDPETASEQETQIVADLVAHETAHMWFGDLVTMEWWDGTWLNEAFATYMSYRARESLFPGWQARESFAVAAEAAREIDGLLATRPIEFPVESPDQAAAMFDTLTYDKGAALLGMLNAYVGERAFRSGLSYYLSAHKYGNTNADDLWKAIDAMSGQPTPVGPMMTSFIAQAGCPLLSVDRSGSDVRIAVSRFSYLAQTTAAPSRRSGSQTSRWLVPLQLEVRSEGTSAYAEVLQGLATELSVDEGMVVANVDGTGFYRVEYSPELALQIMGELDRLSSIEQFVFAKDTWAAVLANHLRLRDFFSFIANLGPKPRPLVLGAITSALFEVDRLVCDRDRDALRRFVCTLLSPELERLGWARRPDDDPRSRTWRGELVRALGTLGHDPSVVATCRALFAAKSTTAESADISEAILEVVASHATAEEWEQLLHRYRCAASPQEEARCLEGLSGCADPVRAEELLDCCLGSLRVQDSVFIVARLLDNRLTGPVAFDFISRRFAEIARRFPDQMLPGMLAGFAHLSHLGGDGTPLFVDNVIAFCREHPFGGMQQLIDQSLEQLQIAVAFAQRERDNLGELLVRQ